MAVSRAMRESDSYKSMTPTAKVLMDLLHMQWRPNKLIAFGVREAGKNIGCKPETAGKAFKMLQDRGFIFCETESLFNSKTGSKAREWRLTWMPFECRDPTHDWEKRKPEI